MLGVFGMLTTVGAHWSTAVHSDPSRIVSTEFLPFADGVWANCPSILMSFVGCLFIQRVIAPSMRWAIELATCRQLPVAKQNEFATRLVGSAHAISACLMCTHTIVSLQPTQSLYGGSPAMSRIIGISTGHFLWELMVSIQYQYGVESMLHAVVGALLYSQALRPFAQWYACRALMFELSTPLLHTRWLLIVLDLGHTPACTAVNISFALVFFCSRIILGWYWAMLMLWDLHDVWQSHVISGRICLMIIALLILVMSGLNLCWMNRIVRSAINGAGRTKLR